MGKFYGKYKAWCRDIHDPEMLGRIRVECPTVIGVGVLSDWAMPCLPPGHFDVPEEGDGVWVEFEDGNPDFPIWVGIWYSGSNTTSTAPWQKKHQEPSVDPVSGQEIDRDKRDHASNPVDDFEHKHFGEHPPYYEPYITGWKSKSGHMIRFSDEPGHEWVNIETANGLCKLWLTDARTPEGSNGRARLTVKGKDGDLTILIAGDDGTITIGNEAGFKISLSADSLSIGGNGVKKALAREGDPIEVEIGGVKYTGTIKGASAKIMSE